MAPGLKSKGKKKALNENFEQNSFTTNFVNIPATEAIDFISAGDQDSGSKTKRNFRKRTIESNWNRYEEHTPGICEDTLRGESFDLLASYKGGAYLQLKEEKEWGISEEDLQKDLCVNFDALAQSLACIPLHNRLHVSQEYFSAEMIEKFEKVAERNCSRQTVTLNSTTHVIDNSPMLIITGNVKDASPEISHKPKLISETSEHIILSLTAGNSWKDDTQNHVLDTVDSFPIEKVSTDIRSKESSSSKDSNDDELADLLSLSRSDKQLPFAEEKRGSSPSVDDWLNELLES